MTIFGAGAMVCTSLIGAVSGCSGANHPVEVPVHTSVQKAANDNVKPAESVKRQDNAPKVLTSDVESSQANVGTQSQDSVSEAPAGHKVELTLQEELRALRTEIAELKQDRKADEGFRARQERELKRKENERAAEIGGAVAKGVLCIMLGAISDSPC